MRPGLTCAVVQKVGPRLRGRQSPSFPVSPRTIWHGCGAAFGPLSRMSVPRGSFRLRAVGFRGVQLCSAAASLALSGGGPVQARDPTDGQATPMAKSALPAPAARMLFQSSGVIAP